LIENGFNWIVMRECVSTGVERVDETSQHLTIEWGRVRWFQVGFRWVSGGFQEGFRRVSGGFRWWNFAWIQQGMACHLKSSSSFRVEEKLTG